jgi:hypothetical protein
MKLFAGDVLICRQARQSKCAYGIVRKANAMPADWMVGSLRSARLWALTHTLETGGNRREFAEVAQPAARAGRRRGAARHR